MHGSDLSRRVLLILVLLQVGACAPSEPDLGGAYRALADVVLSDQRLHWYKGQLHPLLVQWDGGPLLGSYWSHYSDPPMRLDAFLPGVPMCELNLSLGCLELPFIQFTEPEIHRPDSITVRVRDFYVDPELPFPEGAWYQATAVRRDARWRVLELRYIGSD